MAISRESNSKVDPSLNPEQLKKLQDKIEKCKQDVLKVKILDIFMCRGHLPLPLTYLAHGEPLLPLG